MRRTILMLIILAITILPTLSRAETIGPARIQLLEGDAYFRSPDDSEWLPTTVNTPLDEGDAVWCPEGSRIEIQLNDGSLVRIDGGSAMELLAVEDGFNQIHLTSGRMYVHTFREAKDNSLQIDADNTTVLPAGRTRLRIDMMPNSEEDISILKGSAYVEGNGSRTSVRSGEQIAMEEGRSEFLALNPPDNWERWNTNRDRSMARSAQSESYLPDEIKGYAGELNASGYWVRDPEFGMVWRPTVIMADEWAPYRSGRWIWKGDDYVWVSYDSWGWVPYHYGRWVVVPGQGWCWVPPARGDVYWGPGYVGWYRTDGQIGWTPLAPGEVYYGHRSYGRHSVNVTTVNITNTTVVYRNSRVTGGMTVVDHNDFLKGKTVVQPFRKGAAAPVATVSIGSPRIKPLRETRMPIVKAPPRVGQPEAKRIDTRELRQRFPRVRPDSQAPVKTTPPARTAPSMGTPPPAKENKIGRPFGESPVKGAPPERQGPSDQSRPDKEKKNIRPTTEPSVKGAPPETRGPSIMPHQDKEKKTARPVAAEPAEKNIPPERPAPQNGPSRRAEKEQKTPPNAPDKQKKVWKVTEPEHGKE
jgi:hypothetical protein